MPALDIGLAGLPNSPIGALRVIRTARVFHAAEMASAFFEHALPCLWMISPQGFEALDGITAFPASLLWVVVEVSKQQVFKVCSIGEPPKEKAISTTNAFRP